MALRRIALPYEVGQSTPSGHGSSLQNGPVRKANLTNI
jgi:hypothetical protein